MVRSKANLIQWTCIVCCGFALWLSLPLSSSVSGQDERRLSGINWSLVLEGDFDNVDWSLDGRELIIADQRHEFGVVYDWRGRQVLWQFEIDNTRFDKDNLVRSPDGHFIAINQQDSIQVIDLSERSVVQMLTLETQRDGFAIIWTAIAWSSDSKTLAALTSDGDIQLIDAIAGEQQSSFSIVGDENMRDEDFYEFFAWSPNSAVFAAVNYVAGQAPLTAQIQLWDDQGMPYPSELDACPAYGQRFFDVNGLAWSHDSQSLAVSGADGFGICQVGADGTINARRIDGVGGREIEWSPNDEWIAVADSLQRDCSLQIVDLARDTEVLRAAIDDSDSCGIGSLSWSEDGANIALATNSGVWVGRLEF